MVSKSSIVIYMAVIFLLYQPQAVTNRINRAIEYMESLPDKSFLTGYRQEVSFRGRLTMAEAVDTASIWIYQIGLPEGCVHASNLTVERYMAGVKHFHDQLQQSIRGDTHQQPTPAMKQHWQ